MPLELKSSPSTSPTHLGLCAISWKLNAAKALRNGMRARASAPSGVLRGHSICAIRVSWGSKDRRGYGATAARLTPDQKVGSSNLSALILPTRRIPGCGVEIPCQGALARPRKDSEHGIRHAQCIARCHARPSERAKWRFATSQRLRNVRLMGKQRQKGVWRNGSASDSRSEGWELESLCPHFAHETHSWMRIGDPMPGNTRAPALRQSTEIVQTRRTLSARMHRAAASRPRPRNCVGFRVRARTLRRTPM